MHKSNLFSTALLLMICSFISFQGFSQTATGTIEQDPLIPELAKLKAALTKDNELGDRYKIQLFYGATLNEANKIKKEFDEKYNQWPSQIEFETPNYKVWIGDFRNRLEAERAFIKVKEDFKSAFIFKPKG